MEKMINLYNCGFPADELNEIIDACIFETAKENKLEDMKETIKTELGEYTVTPDGDISDGYHTFDELYKHRMIYNACFLKEIAGKYKVERSKRHNDSELCFGGGWFIVVAELPTGQISNHYEERYWDLFDFCETVEKPTIVFDGHTTKDVINRLYNYILNYQNE